MSEPLQPEPRREPGNQAGIRSDMRHKLTKAEMLRGARKAILNPLTPKQFLKERSPNRA